MSKFYDLLTTSVPSDRHRRLENVTNRPWAAYNRYVTASEFARPPPARCQHGRTNLGCLSGVGVQRDDFGNEVPLSTRATPPRTLYPPTWLPPVDLTPSACTDCVLVTGGGRTTSGTITDDLLLDDPGTPPELPADPDLYALASNLTHRVGAEAIDERGAIAASAVLGGGFDGSSL